MDWMKMILLFECCAGGDVCRLSLTAACKRVLKHVVVRCLSLAGLLSSLL